MIPRDIAPQLEKMLSWYQIVSVVGPRQSGKSTLLRSALPTYSYLTLEDSSMRTAAQNDPIGFFNQRHAPLIIDEAQLVPDLFSQLQVVVDELAFKKVSATQAPSESVNGRYVLSGSQNFLLQKSISQSLAGRVGYLHLLPLTFSEIRKVDSAAAVDSFAFTGGYPRLYDSDIPPTNYFRNYVDTYLRRDISEYLDVRNFTGFMTFVRLCAQSVGSLLNISNLAREAGITFDTAKSWLSILQSSFIIFFLEPFSANKRKRLTKTPKLYFYDNGLLNYLLDISSEDFMIGDQRFGNIFENLIISETLKKYTNKNIEPRLSFYRDASGTEVDLIDETAVATGGEARIVEVKSGQTPRDSFFKYFERVGTELGVASSMRSVVYRGEIGFKTAQGGYITAEDYLLE